MQIKDVQSAAARKLMLETDALRRDVADALVQVCRGSLPYGIASPALLVRTAAASGYEDDGRTGAPGRDYDFYAVLRVLPNDDGPPITAADAYRGQCPPGTLVLASEITLRDSDDEVQATRSSFSVYGHKENDRGYRFRRIDYTTNGLLAIRPRHLADAAEWVADVVRRHALESKAECALNRVRLARKGK